MRKWIAALVSASIVVLVALAVAGCGSSDDGGSATAANNSSTGGERHRIVVLGWPTSDPFFGALQKGVADAGRELGQDAKYVFPTQASPNIPDWIQLLKQVVASRPDGLVVADFFPDQADRILADAAKSGIPLVIINSGLDSREKTGALAFIGTNQQATGAAAADEMVAAGVHNPLYVQHCPGTGACQEKQKGFVDAVKATGRNALVLNFTPDQTSNRTAAAEAIRGFLASHSEIDGAVVSGSQLGPLQQAMSQTGRDFKIGTFELTTAALEGVRDGKQLFVTDEQQYLQGYYGVLTIYQYLKYGIHPIGEIFTGPRLLKKDDADLAIRINATSGGVRGGG